MHKNQLVCVCVFVFVFAHVHMCACIRECKHECVHACMCTCMHACGHASTCLCICTHVQVLANYSPPPPPPPFKNYFLLPSFDGSSTFAKVPCFFHLTLFTTGLPVSKTDRLLPWYAIFPSHSPGCLEQDAFPSFSEVRLPPPHFPPHLFQDIHLYSKS